MYDLGKIILDFLIKMLYNIVYKVKKLKDLNFDSIQLEENSKTEQSF